MLNCTHFRLITIHNIIQRIAIFFVFQISRGCDSSKVDVQFERSPDDCLAQEEGQSANKPYKVEMAALPSGRSVLASSGISSIFEPIRSAQAQEGADAAVFRLLGTEDRGLATKARSVISQNPALYVPLISDLLSRGNSRDLAIVDALNALREALPKAYRLPDVAIKLVLGLSYKGGPQVRQAARSYLLNQAIVDDVVVRLASEVFDSQKDALARNNHDQFQQLVITTRDVYYNAGIKYLTDYRGDYGKRARVPDAITKAIASFQRGVDLIGVLSGDDRSPSLGKAYYGMALAFESKAAVTAAEKEFGRNASSKQIDEYIYGLVQRDSDIPFSAAERVAFIGVIDRFINLLNGKELEYLWPEQIDQLKVCKATLKLSCFHGS